MIVVAGLGSLVGWTLDPSGIDLPVSEPELASGAPERSYPTPKRAERADRAPLNGSVRIIDGDTFQAGAEVIRIANIDTPEVGHRADCAEEREMADAATDHARLLFTQAGRIDINRTGTDRYGRTLAHVRLDGRDFGTLMIGADLARVWRGRREDWCNRL